MGPRKPPSSRQTGGRQRKRTRGQARKRTGRGRRPGQRQRGGERAPRRAGGRRRAGQRRAVQQRRRRLNKGSLHEPKHTQHRLRTHQQLDLKRYDVQQPTGPHGWQGRKQKRTPCQRWLHLRQWGCNCELRKPAPTASSRANNHTTTRGCRATGCSPAGRPTGQRGAAIHAKLTPRHSSH